MNAIAIIISLIALVGAGFAFLRASSSHRILSKRTEKQNDRISLLEEKLRRLEGGAGKGRNQPRQEEQEQVREPKQKQRDRRQDRQQEEQPQERQPQERQPQERQQERRQREKQPQERQPQAQERGQQERPMQEQQQASLQEEGRQQRPKRDKRRRNEPREGGHEPREQREPRNQPEPEEALIVSSTPIDLDSAGANLLDELEQAAASTDTHPVAERMPVAAPVEEPARPGKAYAIIPEDGVIRQHQLQQHPDSDSYIEIDAPGEGENRTHYRFNLAGNHAFVISQGIDRLENAFSFEKPSNRMVSRVVQQLDGVLARVGNGWKIEEKARIDFR